MWDYKTSQIVIHILKLMGYKILGELDNKSIDYCINLIKSKSISDKNTIEFINHFL